MVTLTEDDDIYLASDSAGEIVNGLGGDDLLGSGPGDDTLDGGTGKDGAFYLSATSGVTVNLAVSGPQNVGGGLGTDTLVNIEDLLGSLGNDVLTGNSQANELVGLNGDDTLTGSGGDDLLAGGEGKDSFKFSFTVAEGEMQESFSGWLAEQGLSLEGASQRFFSSKYTAYLQHLVDEYGIGEDLNGDGKIKIRIKQNDPDGVPFIEGLSREDADAMFDEPTSVMVKTGRHWHSHDYHGHKHGHKHDHKHDSHGHKHDHKHTHERWYSDSFTLEGGGEKAVTSADGKDVILDFAWDVDSLDFSGLGAMSQTDFEATFTVTEVDWGANGVADGVMDTVLAMEGDSTWSVTLVGVAGHAEAEFYDQIKFA
jgi:Ca2+-binding RTX toxin-like protein